MHFVILGEHEAHDCPTSNSKTKALMLEVASQIPKYAEQNGVRIVSGPFANREHITVAVVEADRAENVDAFIVASRLAQWNRVRVIPSHPLQDAMSELEGPSLF
jgi:DNA-binding LacI/PurR family transcriptional regulator